MGRFAVFVSGRVIESHISRSEWRYSSSVPFMAAGSGNLSRCRFRQVRTAASDRPASGPVSMASRRPISGSAFQRGRVMTIDEGVAFAVQDKQPSKPASAAMPQPHAVLTRRQLDIARLVADDLSNKQIAARLFLSKRTVETHVANILNKLGLNSRVQLGRWLADVTGTRQIAVGERR